VFATDRGEKVEEKHREVTQNLMNAFFRFRHLHRHGRPMHGLKQSETRILLIVKRKSDETGKGIRISDLSRIMHVTSPTVTQLINRLEEKGLVQRKNDPNDRRYIRVVLTTQGEAILKQAADAFFAGFSRLVNHLGEEKSRLLAQLLTESFDFITSDVQNIDPEQE